MVEATGCNAKAPMKTLLSAPEKRFILWLAPKFPAWVTSWQLTLMTILWAFGVISFGMLARKTGNLHWLWVAVHFNCWEEWLGERWLSAVGPIPVRILNGPV